MRLRAKHERELSMRESYACERESQRKHERELSIHGRESYASPHERELSTRES